jgi:hypothetical protein
MMKNLAVKYGVLLGGLLFMFGNFIACGAQLYNVSMKDDHQAEQVPAEAKDPSSATYGLHAPSGWKQLPIPFKVGMRLTAEQKSGLLKAMTTWETAVGRKLFLFEGVHENIDGDSFSDLYSSLPDEINGDYLDNDWGKTGKPTVVLATTIWDNVAGNANLIETADIRFNGNFYVIGDSLKDMADEGREVVDMQTLALHELGHLLGLSHIDSNIDSYSIMTPSLYIGEGLTNRRLSKGDLIRIQKIYGCQGVSCDVEKTLAKIELLSVPGNLKTSEVETDTAH